MEVHKPKFLHNWREFLVEIGTIVIGVLIALAAEQAAEAVHWHYQAAQAEAAIGGELEADLAQMAEREEIDPCIRKRIAELRDKLIQPGTQWKADPQMLASPPPTVLPSAYRTPSRLWFRNAWQTAVTNDSVSHMSPDRAAVYGATYRQVEHINDLQDSEFQAEQQMTALSYDLVLSPDKRQDYLNPLGRLDALNDLIVAISQQSLDHVARIGIGPNKRAIAELFATQRHYRGACVIEAKLPLVE
jgi:hypothetical protein